MRYIYQHIQHILTQYQGELPLAHYLKLYFKKHPILGSRDRKLLSEMCYSYYRAAKGLVSTEELSIADKVNYSLLLTEGNLKTMSKLLPETLAGYYGGDFENNIKVVAAEGITFDIARLLAAEISVSKGISKEAWLYSMLRRPKLFIRVTEKDRASVKQLLQTHEISFEALNATCFALENGTSIEKIVPPKMYRIQDASSQATAQYFPFDKAHASCWDCCSGAGGKSLLAMEHASKLRLTVSDIRKSILENLSERFKRYDYPKPERLLLSAADPLQTEAILGARRFDYIIADVPCSGSGTWARTPEQLFFFKPDSLPLFAERQKTILINALRYLKSGASLVYITCSVFEAENEAVVEAALSAHPDIQLQMQQLIEGIAIAADSMFVAVLKKG